MYLLKEYKNIVIKILFLKINLVDKDLILNEKKIFFYFKDRLYLIKFYENQI